MNPDSSENYYDSSYKEAGMAAQRRYPNEELCRFIGRNFGCMSRSEKNNYKNIRMKINPARMIRPFNKLFNVNKSVRFIVPAWRAEFN